MPYIDPFQFGSVKKSSTTHALVHLVHYWLTSLEIPNTIIRTCFIDFSKAFDLIDHNILMHKLQLLNVNVQMFKNFVLFDYSNGKYPQESSSSGITLSI